MGNTNPTKNQAALAKPTGAERSTLEHQRFSEAGNVRVEKAFGKPDWRFSKTLSGTAPVADQSDPNTSEPDASEVFDGAGFAGLNGYLKFDDGSASIETVTVELWAKDPVNDGNWFLVDTAFTVNQFEELRFENQVRGRLVWLRFVDIGASIDDVYFYGCGE